MIQQCHSLRLSWLCRLIFWQMCAAFWRMLLRHASTLSAQDDQLTVPSSGLKFPQHQDANFAALRSILRLSLSKDAIFLHQTLNLSAPRPVLLLLLHQTLASFAQSSEYLRMAVCGGIWRGGGSLATLGHCQGHKSHTIRPGMYHTQDLMCCSERPLYVTFVLLGMSWSLIDWLLYSRWQEHMFSATSFQRCSEMDQS